MSSKNAKVVLFSFFMLFAVLLWSVDNAESRKIISVRETPKSHRSIERLYDGLYANGYGYGKPIENYKLEISRIGRSEKSNRKVRKVRKRKVKKLKKGRIKTYAKNYKTWVPYQGKIKKEKSAQTRVKPRRVVPDIDVQTINHVQIPNTHRRRRRKKHKMSPLQRPSPPPEPEISYNDYDFTVDPGVEDYFPEETKPPYEDYDVDEKAFHAKRPKGHQVSSRLKKKPSGYEYVAYESDGGPYPYSTYTKNNRGADGAYSSVSYSHFITHPPSKKKNHASGKYDYDDYLDESESQSFQNEVKHKRKKQSPRKRYPAQYDEYQVEEGNLKNHKTTFRSKGVNYHPNDIDHKKTGYRNIEGEFQSDESFSGGLRNNYKDEYQTDEREIGGTKSNIRNRDIEYQSDRNLGDKYRNKDTDFQKPNGGRNQENDYRAYSNSGSEPPRNSVAGIGQYESDFSSSGQQNNEWAHTKPSPNNYHTINFRPSPSLTIGNSGSTYQQPNVVPNYNVASPTYSQPVSPYSNPGTNYGGINQFSYANPPHHPVVNPGHHPVVNPTQHPIVTTAHHPVINSPQYPIVSPAHLPVVPSQPTYYGQPVQPHVIPTYSPGQTYSNPNYPINTNPPPSYHVPRYHVSSDNPETINVNNAQINNRYNQGYTPTYLNNPQPQTYSNEVNRQSSVIAPTTPPKKSSVPSEDEFITRHLSLYNNGISGVPIQGDGFGSYGDSKIGQAFKRSKDFDVGYGQLQIDESDSNAQKKHRLDLL